MRLPIFRRRFCPPLGLPLLTDVGHRGPRSLCRSGAGPSTSFRSLRSCAWQTDLLVAGGAPGNRPKARHNVQEWPVSRAPLGMGPIVPCRQDHRRLPTPMWLVHRTRRHFVPATTQPPGLENMRWPGRPARLPILARHHLALPVVFDATIRCSKPRRQGHLLGPAENNAEFVPPCPRERYAAVSPVGCRGVFQSKNPSPDPDPLPPLGNGSQTGAAARVRTPAADGLMGISKRVYAIAKNLASIPTRTASALMPQKGRRTAMSKRLPLRPLHIHCACIVGAGDPSRASLSPRAARSRCLPPIIRPRDFTIQDRDGCQFFAFRFAPSIPCCDSCSRCPRRGRAADPCFGKVAA